MCNKYLTPCFIHILIYKSLFLCNGPPAHVQPVLVFNYLKLWPVHVHAGAVSVAEPLQIFLWAGWCDGAFKLSVHCSITVNRERGFGEWVMFTWLLSCYRNTFSHVGPLVLCEVEVAFDIQQHLPEETQPLLFKLLALVEHLLHVLHVWRGAFTQLIQSLLILLLSLCCNTHGHYTIKESFQKQSSSRSQASMYKPLALIC